MKTFVGIDNGTQSTKVIFYDPDERKILAAGSAAHQIISSTGGRREQNLEWWIEALGEAFSQIPPEIKKTAAALGVSGQQHGFVPLDEKGRGVYNAKLWNDTETAQECREITEAFGGEAELIKRTGNAVLPGFTAGKVRWLKKHQPEAYRKLAHILLPHDFINYHLTGEIFTEAGDASGTAFFDVYKRKWSRDVLRAVDPDTDLYSKLPELRESSQIAAVLSADRAKEYGLPPGIPVSTGGGDNMMGAIGTGAVRPGVLTVSLGTSGTIYSYTAEPMVDPEARLSAFCSSTGGWLPLLCTMNCTVAVEEFRRLFDMDLDETDCLAEEVASGSDGLITLPFFNGERTPNLPKGKACLMGMDGDNLSRGHILRSAMEAAAFGVKLGLEAFQEQGLRPDRVHLIGGGSNSPVWRQIIADVFQLPVRSPVHEEAAAFGAALQALWALGGDGSIEDISTRHVLYDPAKESLPQRQFREVYLERYGEYLDYLRAMEPLFQ